MVKRSPGLKRLHTGTGVRVWSVKLRIVNDWRNAVDDAFGIDVDYAMLIKTYQESTMQDRRCSPGEFVNALPIPVTGNPKSNLISTSHIERQNLTMRMQLRRFTRLTNAFSKKLSHLKAACALHFAHYNFCRVHQTLRVTPAMAAGIADHIFSIEEIANLLGGSARIAA